MVITWAANTGDQDALTFQAATATNGSVATAMTSNTETIEGVALRVVTFVDDDPAANLIISKKVTTETNSAGAPTAGTTYHRHTYDSTDVLNVGTTTLGATEAQFEAANALIQDGASNLVLTYRTAATGSGISYFVVG